MVLSSQDVNTGSEQLSMMGIKFTLQNTLVYNLLGIKITLAIYEAYLLLKQLEKKIKFIIQTPTPALKKIK